MKNCGEYVQFEVAEQHVLQEMVKIIQKKVVFLLPSLPFLPLNLTQHIKSNSVRRLF